MGQGGRGEPATGAGDGAYAISAPAAAELPPVEPTQGGRLWIGTAFRGFQSADFVARTLP